MYQGDIVVARDAVPQRRQSLINPLHDDLVWQRVSDVLQFLVGGRVGQQQTVSIANRHPPDQTGARNRALHYRNVI
jgi:hypothetical protein